MFTILLAFLSFLSILIMYIACFKRPKVTLKDSEIATKLVEIRYLKAMSEQSNDGLKTIEFIKEREEKIEQLLEYIEKNSISYGSLHNAQIVKLDSYRQRQSA